MCKTQFVDLPIPYSSLPTLPVIKDLDDLIQRIERSETLPSVEKGEDLPQFDPKVKENNGDNGNYYDILLSNKDGQEILVRCLDVIEHLQMTFPEGEAFKAIWRKSAARLGNGKADHNPVYDAKKIRFYGESIERMALKEANK